MTMSAPKMFVSPSIGAGRHQTYTDLMNSEVEIKEPAAGKNFMQLKISGSLKNYIQLPASVTLPMGAIRNSNDTGEVRLKTLVSLNTDNPDCEELIRALNYIDDQVTLKIKENIVLSKKPCFKKDMTRIIKTNPDRPPSFYMRIEPQRGSLPGSEIYNKETNEKLEFESLAPPPEKDFGGILTQARGDVIARIAYAWMHPSTGYGIAVVLHKAKVSLNSVEEIDFMVDEEDEEEDGMNMTSGATDFI